MKTPQGWVRAADAQALIARFGAELVQIEADCAAAVAMRVAAGEVVGTDCEDIQRAHARIDQCNARFFEALRALNEAGS